MSSEFEYLTLGEITVNFDNKRKPVKGPDRKPGPYPYYGASGIVDYVDSYIFDGEYLLIAEDGENLRTRQLPFAFLAQGKFWVNNHAHIVTGNERALTQYLKYALLATDITPYLTGAVMPKITKGNLNNITVPCPTITVQKQIVDILSSLDDRIALLRETNATLEAIAQALFKSWFVDFDPVHANAGAQAPSLPAEIQALFPSRLVESSQGLIPEGWEIATLDDVSEVGIGKTPPRKEQHWFSENSDDIRWVSIRDMGESGSYLSSTNEYLTKEAVTRFNVRVVPDNTVMLSFKMTIGRVAISDGDMTTNEAIAHFKLTETSPLTSEFIYLHLKSFDYSTLSSTSSIADAVNSKTVKNIPIVLPVNDVLNEFQSRIQPVMQRIKMIEQQIKTVSNLRDTLLPRLISGQLRLPEAEAVLAEVG